jgi:HK97 family phage portal protein
MIATSEIIADHWGVGDQQARVYKGDGVGMSWFYDALGKQDEAVRTETLLRQGTVWAGVNIIAGDMGQIPLTVKRVVEGGEEDAPSHPIARLLTEGPNYWQTIDQWVEWMVATSIIWGNAISQIERDETGNVVALHPIPPMYVDWNVYDGEPFYYITAPDAVPRVLRINEVVHLRTISTTGFWGMRLAEVAYSELLLEKSAKTHAANVFNKGAFPSGVLSVEGNLQPEARKHLRDDWESMHRGGPNAGRTAVLTNKTTYVPLTISPHDAQLVEMISHDAILVGKILGISPSFLGDMRHNATRANLEEESKQYFNRTLRRRVLSLEKELQRKLIAFQRTYHVRADASEFLKGDLLTQVEVAGKAIASRIWTRNEARKYVGMTPVEGGDEFENPAIDLKQQPEGEPEEEPDDEQDTELEADPPEQPEAMARRIRRIETNRLAQAVTTSKDFLAFVEKFYGKFAELIADQTGLQAPDVSVYAAGRKAVVLAMADKMTPQEMAAALTDQPIEADAMALAAYLGGIYGDH